MAVSSRPMPTRRAAFRASSSCTAQREIASDRVDRVAGEGIHRCAPPALIQRKGAALGRPAIALPESQRFLGILDLTDRRPRTGDRPAVLNGSVGRNCGGFRACVTCSNPDASVISLPSLKAVPMKLMPTGTPNTNPIGTLIMG